MVSSPQQWSRPLSSDVASRRRQLIHRLAIATTKKLTAPGGKQTNKRSGATLFMSIATYLLGKIKPTQEKEGQRSTDERMSPSSLFPTQTSGGVRISATLVTDVDQIMILRSISSSEDRRKAPVFKATYAPIATSSRPSPQTNSFIFLTSMFEYCVGISVGKE